MKKIVVTALAFLAGASAAFVLPSVARESVPTIESCAGHLPAGHKVQFHLSGVVDTTGSQARFRGDLGITGADELEDAPEIGEFVECVSALLR